MQENKKVSHSLPENALETIIIKSNILVLGTSIEYLEEKVRSIREFTRVVFPLTKIDNKEIAVRSCKELFGDMEFDKKFEEYTYCVNVHSVLPEFISTLLELSNTYRAFFPKMNCHSSSLAVAGVLPIIGLYPHEQIQMRVDKIKPQKLRAGDIIYLNYSEGHSFVFIDKDLCFSTNGIGSSLQINRIEDVLVRYKAPLDCLGANNNLISTYRRVHDSNVPESITLILAKYYRAICETAISRSSANPGIATHKLINRFDTTMSNNTFSDFCLDLEKEISTIMDESIGYNSTCKSH